MASITLKDLSQNIDVSQVARDARGRWEKTERGRLSVESKLLNLLPIGLVVMVLVFYSLSAPHTAHILDMVTPGWGIVAPVGFEIGLLIISALMEAGWHARIMHGVLWLLLSMSVVINVAASFLVVVSASPVVGEDITKYTFQDLVGLYPTLPASIQIVLLMVIPVGFTIPVITKLAGEAVVKLALGKVELSSTSLDELWAKVEQREVKSALMQKALELGAGVRTAGKWSSLIVDQMYGADEPDDPVNAVGNSWEAREIPTKKVYAFHEIGQGHAEIYDNSQIPTQIGNGLSPKLSTAVQWLTEHPDDMMLSGRQLEQSRRPGGLKLSYRTWNDAKGHVE